MKNQLCLAVLAVLMAWLPASGQTLLAHLDGMHVEGWTYENNDGTVLSSTTISTRKITLYTTKQGTVKALVSPWMDCAGFDTLHVVMNCDLFPEVTDLNLLAVNCALLDGEGQTVSQTLMPVTTRDLEQVLVAKMALPKGGGTYSLRMTAPRADVNNCVAVKRVKLYGLSGLRGDVNSDGVVDVDDLNILINIVLRKDSASNYGQQAFVAGGTVVDVADINIVINIMLHKEE
ncbi:MAG: hypothetical protein IKR25_04330 [Muribaculaceae bacterium]|nr:hypothetical protein [Muribaculaceae bacterium]